MPELPEVETFRRAVLRRLRGQRVVMAALHRRDMCESWVIGARGVRRIRTTPDDLLQGAIVADVVRHGKQLAIVADNGRAVCVHLGMSGSLTWTIGEETSPHTHAEWRTAKGRLLFVDPRRFGGLWTYPTPEALYAHRWAALGPDALTMPAAEFGIALASSRRPIKSALLDQSLIAGVGNIYADEALFAAGVHPLRPGATLAPEVIARLHVAVVDILSRAVAARGSSIRSYRDGDGKPGAYQAAHAVYDRSGRPCVVCGAILESRPVGGRTTTWCPSCQAR